MSEEMLVRHCSPTLAGLKTGNMFTCAFENADNMREDLRRLNCTFRKKGLRIIPLRYRNNRALIYVYRPVKLSEDLSQFIYQTATVSRSIDLPFANSVQ